MKSRVQASTSASYSCRRASKLLAVVPLRPLHVLVLSALLAVSVPAATAAPAKDEPLLVGAAIDHYPYSYLDANNTITGFAVDLLDEVARVGGLNIRRITGRSADLNRRFFAGEFPVAQVYTYSPRTRGADRCSRRPTSR